MSPMAPTVRRGLLPVVLMSLALVVAAVPALNVALPNLAADTGASLSQLQWIVDAYALVFAGLLLPAGALGDRYGRKPVLVFGLAIFALGSGAAAFTHDPQVLIAPARHHGCRGSVCHAHHPLHHHDVVSSGAQRTSRRGLGRGCRCRRRLRTARLRHAARGLGVAVGLRVQRDRRCGVGDDGDPAGSELSGCSSAACGLRGGHAVHGRAGRHRVRGDRRARPRMGRPDDSRRLRDRILCARTVGGMGVHR